MSLYLYGMSGPAMDCCLQPLFTMQLLAQNGYLIVGPQSATNTRTQWSNRQNKDPPNLGTPSHAKSLVAKRKMQVIYLSGP